MLLEKLIEEEGWGNLKTVQAKVDSVLDWLWARFWVDTVSYDVRNLQYLAIFNQQVVREKAGELACIAAKSRQGSSTELEQELVATLNKIRQRSPGEKSNFSEEELQAFYHLFAYCGEPIEAKYDGEEILKLGFLPHSCTSFAVLAFDLLTKLGVKGCEVIFGVPKNERSDHSILRYKTEDGAVLNCDAKWQRHPHFFQGKPAERQRFTTDPDYFVHGVRTEPDWHGEVVPKKYEMIAVIRQAD